MENTNFENRSCRDFVKVLASKAPVPGGGGASALVGAVGTALGSMVCNLTKGKKKYAAWEEDIDRILTRAAGLEDEFLNLIDEDARSFEPLSKAYGIPKDDPQRDSIMENALRNACAVPLKIMQLCCEVIDLHAELAEKGSTLAVSDVGVGVACTRAALTGASLNIYINTKSMLDRSYAESLEKEADALIESGCAKADQIYNSVVSKLR